MFKNLWAKIKIWFEKDLNAILAPIHRIEGDLSRFITKQQYQIAEHTDTVANLQQEITAKQATITQAATVQANIANLVAK